MKKMSTGDVTPKDIKNNYDTQASGIDRVSKYTFSDRTSEDDTAVQEKE